MTRNASPPAPARKLVVFYDGKGYGGAEAHLLLLLRHLDRTRYEPHVVVAARLWPQIPIELAQKLKASGAPIHITPSDTGNKTARFFDKVKMLRSIGAELAYVGTSTAIGLRSDLLAIRLAGMRIVRLLHMPAPSMKEFHWARWSAREVRLLDRLVALDLTVSDTDREGLCKEFGISKDKIEVCYHGLELDRFVSRLSPAQARRGLGLDPEVLTVGVIGRLATEKGHRYLVEAAPQILKEAGPVQFLLVGNGERRDELKAMVEERGLREHFVFAGFQEDVTRWIEAVDVIVMPSLFESAGLVMLECMAMERPVIVSDLPAIRDHVTNDTCVLIPTRDPTAIAREVIALLRDAQRREELGRRGAELVRRRFDLKRHVGQLMLTFDRVLNASNTWLK